LTPSVQLMALGLHIPPVRATCERPRMVVMVAQDLLVCKSKCFDLGF